MPVLPQGCACADENKMKFDIEVFKRFLAAMRHRLAHRLGTNYGRVETFWDGENTLMVGFRCDGCGELLHVHESYHNERRRREV